jgi:hypothetical protein
MILYRSLFVSGGTLWMQAVEDVWDYSGDGLNQSNGLKDMDQDGAGQAHRITNQTI